MLENMIINRDPLKDTVVRVIEESILTNKLKPGDHLNEVKLSNSLGISRGPVREAIIELVTMGLADRIPFKGAVVSSLSDQDVAELKMCRMPIELLAIQSIIEHGQIDATVIELQACIDRMKIASTQDNLLEFLSLDFSFHNDLIIHSKNKLIEEMWRPISIRLRRYFYLNSKQAYVAFQEVIEQHEGIVNALKVGDAQQVNQLMQIHRCWI